MNQTQVEAYEKVIEFLQENEGKKMRVGVHAHNIAMYNVLENGWVIEGKPEWLGIEIDITDGNNTVTIINGNEDEIEGYQDEKGCMDVFPSTGDFELYTEHATICFELL